VGKWTKPQLSQKSKQLANPPASRKTATGCSGRIAQSMIHSHLHVTMLVPHVPHSRCSASRQWLLLMASIVPASCGTCTDCQARSLVKTTCGTHGLGVNLLTVTQAGCSGTFFIWPLLCFQNSLICPNITLPRKRQKANGCCPCQAPTSCCVLWQ
jgi:hypothetical protein